MKITSKNTSTNRAVAGFTLMEVAIVVAIVGIVSTIGFYNFLNGMPNRRVKEASRELYAAFQRASIEALNRNQNVTLTLDPVAESFRIDDAGGNNIRIFAFANGIDLYNIAAPGNTITYTPRGMLTGVSRSALLQYAPDNNGAVKMGVRVTTTGSISLIDEITDVAYAW